VLSDGERSVGSIREGIFETKVLVIVMFFRCQTVVSVSLYASRTMPRAFLNNHTSCSQVHTYSHRLGGVMVSVLGIRLKVRGCKTGRGDGFFRAKKSAAHLCSVESKARGLMS
jgi:hypothetical protein